MIQRRDRVGLALKTIGELLRGNLDRDVAIQPRIARLPHFAHAAFADGRDDLIRAEFVAGLQFHVRRRGLQSL